MTVNSGIPSNEKEAMKLGRGGKFASPGAPADLAEIQNQAARAHHAPVEYKFRIETEYNHCLCCL